MNASHRVGVVALALACTTGVARADGLDAERFAPATGPEQSFHIEHPAVPYHLGWGLGLFFDVADDPVVERDMSDDIVSRPLDTAVSADLLASVGLFGWAELGVHLPLQLVYSGDEFSGGGVMLSPSGGVGDLRLVPKAVLARRGDLDSHWLVGVALPVTAPTGNDEALRGAGGMTVEPRLLAALHVGDIGLAANVGYRWRSEHPQGLPWGDELALALMGSYDVTAALTARVELFGGKQIGADIGGADFPFEILGGLVYQIAESWDLHAGASLGMTDGIGDPDLRVVAGVRFRKRVPVEHGFADSDGDGILDKDDACPDDAEDLDGYRDEDGCPEPDNDEDGIADTDDECPDMPEERDGNGDGCPDRPHVEIVDGKIVVFGKVRFGTASADIQKESDPLLDQLAAALDSNPQVKKVRIEGHTDDVGKDDVNQWLSEERAKSVKKALVERGIDSDRLETKGYGETKPVAPNTHHAGRAKNRRVEFVIVE